MGVKDLTGRKFGRLTVIRRSGTAPNRNVIWECVCEADGNTVHVRSSSLLRGITKSCGCLSKEKARERMKVFARKHGYEGTPTYRSWDSMKRRCTDPNSTSYKRYGAKGVTVCDRWSDFANFLADMGERPKGHTLDRYPNRNGNYEPGNCRWATPRQQSWNRGSTVMITFRGKEQPRSVWAKEVGVPDGTVADRLEKGWSVEDALTAPPREVGKEITYAGKTQSIGEWAAEKGQTYGNLWSRLEKGWSIADAIDTPTGHKRLGETRHNEGAGNESEQASETPADQNLALPS